MVLRVKILRVRILRVMVLTVMVLRVKILRVRVKATNGVWQSSIEGEERWSKFLCLITFKLKSSVSSLLTK